MPNRDRETYTTPRLVRHGSLEEMTHGGTAEKGEKVSKPIQS